MIDFEPKNPEAFKKLTAKQQAFVIEFLRCNNKTRAAKLAGYEHHASAWDVLKNPVVCEEIEHARKNAAKSLGIDARFVLAGFKQIAERMYLLREDEPSAAEAQVAAKVLENLGKHIGLFKERIEMSVKSHEEMLDELE